MYAEYDFIIFLPKLFVNLRVHCFCKIIDFKLKIKHDSKNGNLIEIKYSTLNSVKSLKTLQYFAADKQDTADQR